MKALSVVSVGRDSSDRVNMPRFRATLQFFAVIAACFLPCMAEWTHAQERITAYSVELAVQADASLLVTESITVQAEHDAVRHGIFRSVPTLTWHDRKVRTYGVELVEARMDGAPVPCRTERGDMLTSFILGDPDKKLARGEHTFALAYRATGHVRREKGGYAIHYNATGSQWSFPIDEAAVSVTLPDGARLTDASAYILHGRERMDGGTVSEAAAFAATRPLEPGEALVVQAAWQGGSISLPAPGLREQLAADGFRIMAAVGVLPLCCFVFLWFFFRRVRKPAVVPLYAPPRDISPGLAAHICGKPENAARADLLWTAARGFMRMQRDGGKWTFLPSWPRHVQRDWQNTACLDIADRLFSGRAGESVARLENGMPEDWSAVESDNGERLHHALNGVQDGYKKRMRDLAPAGRLLPAAGAVVNAALLYAAMYVAGWPGIYDGMDLTNDFLGIGLCSLLAALPLLCLKKGVLQRIALLVSGALCVLALGLWLDFDRQFWLPVLSCVFTPLLFWRCFPCRPTPKGLEARAAVEGLALYVGTAGKKRPALCNVPEDTVEKYEEMLPYAVALGLAEAWEKRFVPVLAAAGYAAAWVDDFRCSNDEEKALSSSENAGYAAALAAVSAVTAAYGASQRDGGGSDGGGSNGDSGGGNSGGGGGGW
ncbi:MAG: DUF2207 domain-containing protein [Desulfovibrio desulfuricans]|jgi:uncharacterized membrane protein YgcG|nr:DUF2207 domain-containing protein [Desulfovibrio desulfuricans]